MKAEEKLAAWTAAWVADGVITPAQREIILARHPVTAGDNHRFLAILASVGGSLLLVGVSLVIKSNWDDIGDWIKILGLVALLLGWYALGWRWKVSPGRFPKTGDMCLMVGAVGFLLGIALVSQIFHLDSRPANGVLLWWAGIVGLPWVTRARGAQLVSVVAGLTWFGMELGARDSWLRLAGANFPGDESWLFAAMGVVIGFAVLLFGLGLRGGRHDIFAGVHEKVGLLVASGSLYVLGFTWSARSWHTGRMGGAPWPPVLVATLLLALAGAWAFRRNRAETKSLAAVLLLALLPAFAHLGGIEILYSDWWWGGLACAALFVLNLGMIRTGLASGRESWINLGMGLIALNVVTRYFLLFGTMLEGGLFFIVTGLLVIGCGWYLERKRRTLVGALRREAQA